MDTNYILVPHFYRLNWAREMSEFLRASGGFEYLGAQFEYGNYSKAGRLRDAYLNYLIHNGSQLKNRTLFFVNLNDYIYFDRRGELRDKFKIAGFMRGSRFFDGEPGNASFGKDSLANMQAMEYQSLMQVDRLYLGSNSFCNFLLKKMPDLNVNTIKIVGIPIFQKPCFYDKSQDEMREIIQRKKRGLILWNHRLQKQKNPWVLFELSESVKKSISICTPEALSAAYSKEMKQHENIFHNIIRDNGKKREKYLNELKCAQFVLSTSEHETWGNSVIEGIMNGAIPIAPDGELCSYKELLPSDYLYPQRLILKNSDKLARNKNMIDLSNIIQGFDYDANIDRLISLQLSLWDEYNKHNWLTRI